MPADLTAAEIIALLRERPGCCGVLGIQGMELASLWSFSTLSFDMTVWANGHIDSATRFRRWLTGACVEKCEELGIDVVRANSSGSEWYFGPRNRCIESDVQLYPTFLHAATAAIDAHCKETP